MRRLTFLAPAALLMLSACASGMSSPENAYSNQLQRLAELPRAGGILSPTGAVTGRVETENVCKINGETARAD